MIRPRIRVSARVGIAIRVRVSVRVRFGLDKVARNLLRSGLGLEVEGSCLYTPYASSHTSQGYNKDCDIGIAFGPCRLLQRSTGSKVRLGRRRRLGLRFGPAGPCGAPLRELP